MIRTPEMKWRMAVGANNPRSTETRFPSSSRDARAGGSTFARFSEVAQVARLVLQRHLSEP